MRFIWTTLMLITFIPLSIVTGGVVASDPLWKGGDRDIVVSKDDEVYIYVTADSGDVIGSSVQAPGASVETSGYGDEEYILRFQNAEGQKIQGNIYVIHTDSSETCESGKTFDFNVWVAKVEFSSLSVTGIERPVNSDGFGKAILASTGEFSGGAKIQSPSGVVQKLDDWELRLVQNVKLNSQIYLKQAQGSVTYYSKQTNDYLLDSVSNDPTYPSNSTKSQDKTTITLTSQDNPDIHIDQNAWLYRKMNTHFDFKLYLQYRLKFNGQTDAWKTIGKVDWSAAGEATNAIMSTTGTMTLWQGKGTATNGTGSASTDTPIVSGPTPQSTAWEAK